MIQTKRTEVFCAVQSALIAVVITGCYMVYAYEYLLGKTVLNDNKINIALLCAVITGASLYQFQGSRFPPQKQERRVALCQNVVRYFLAFIFLYYAFIKMCGNMFSSPLAILNTPLYKLSGFALAWRFFGYSPWYNGGIILFQIVCGILLLFTLSASLLSGQTTVLGKVKGEQNKSLSSYL